MLLLCVLLPILPLAMATCPSFFEGLDATTTFIGTYGSGISIIARFDEAVDTACGRSNYTSAFWSMHFYQELIGQIVSNSSDGLAPYKPFFARLQEKINALDRENASEGEIEAKHYLDSIFSRNRKMQASRVAFHEHPPANSSDFMDRFWSNPKILFPKIMKSFLTAVTLTPPATIATMQTMKDGFGVIESDQIKQDRVDTAMRAMERVGLNNQNEKLSELFARLYVLVNNEVGIPRSSPFEKFAEWAEHDWQSSEIGPLEILPAAELLYVQYRSLKINESLIYVDWMLMSNVMFPQNETREEKMQRKSKPIVSHVDVMMALANAREERKAEFDRMCPSQKVSKCFKDIPEEAKKEIMATFPELFVYLKNRFNNFLTSSLGEDISPIEKKVVEGSGEGLF